MAFSAYNAHVRIVPQGAGAPAPVTLPVDSMTVRAVPYTGDGPTVVTLFRGERKFIQPDWGYVVEMTWKNLGSSLPLLRSALDLWLVDPGINFVKHLYVAEVTPGTFDSNKYLPNLVPDLTEETVNVIFDERFRRKKATLRLLTRYQDLPLYDWTTNNT